MVMVRSLTVANDVSYDHNVAITPPFTFPPLQCLLLLLVYHGRGATEAGSRGVLRVTFPGDHDGDGEGDSDMTVIVEDELQLEAEAGDSEDLAARALAPVSGRRLDEGRDEVIRVKRQFTTKIDARTGKPVKTGCKIEGYQTKEREVCEEIVERICEVTHIFGGGLEEAQPVPHMNLVTNP